MTRLERFILSMTIALLAAGTTLIIANAQTPGPTETAEPEAETATTKSTTSVPCGNCHSEIQNAWFTGAHGHATTDPVFSESWTSQGKPGACLVCHVTGYDPATATWEQDGVACEACHDPVPANHPSDPMPIYRSADLCGRCHSDTRFDWADWEISAHYKRDMTCTVCHDPHTAGLKAVESDDGLTTDTSSLCLNCHKDYSMDFPYSQHAQQGIRCVDCHLRHLGDTSTDDIHTVPDHSFEADISTCTACHAEQMHSSGETAFAPTALTATPMVLNDSGTGAQTETPSPVSPAGFAGLAGLVGLAGGMVLSPWLERLYRKANKGKEDKND
ncbi:MAG: cytochrome c3 family protein [Anaerolineales bacterium]|jgi:predicted CXXCH cytochrome family protein